MYGLAWLAPGQNSEEEPVRRFWLWVDGVGGYLVCLDSRITIGQAVQDATVDVPLLADVCRLHATLTRDTEGYLIEAFHGVRINGRPVTRSSLQTGDCVSLGASCQVQFRQPSCRKCIRASGVYGRPAVAAGCQWCSLDGRHTPPGSRATDAHLPARGQAYGSPLSEQARAGRALRGRDWHRRWAAPGTRCPGTGLEGNRRRFRFRH